MTDNLTRIDPKRLEEILQIAPFHRWLGLTLRSCSNEQLELEMPWRDEIASAHGGVLASLIDLTGLYTLLSQGTGAKATANLRVDYHRPATSGPLVASGKIIKIGKNISVAETRVYGPTGNLLASGRGAYVC